MPDIPFGVGPDIFEPPVLPSTPLGGFQPPFPITDMDLGGMFPPGSNDVGGTGGGFSLGKLGDALKKMFGNKDQNALALLAGLIPLLISGRGSSPQIPPEILAGMDEAMQMTNARFRRADPLHQANTQLAFSRLPISARQGISLFSVPLPGMPAGAGTPAGTAPPSSVNPPPSEVPPDQRGPRYRNNPPPY